jgi:hypothetical protein
MDERSSWMRVAITIAIDWRFVMALVILVLALLLREPNSREDLHPSETTQLYQNANFNRTKNLRANRRLGSLRNCWSLHRPLQLPAGGIDIAAPRAAQVSGDPFARQRRLERFYGGGLGH